MPRTTATNNTSLSYKLTSLSQAPAEMGYLCTDYYYVYTPYILVLCTIVCIIKERPTICRLRERSPVPKCCHTWRHRMEKPTLLACMRTRVPRTLLVWPASHHACRGGHPACFQLSGDFAAAVESQVNIAVIRVRRSSSGSGRAGRAVQQDTLFPKGKPYGQREHKPVWATKPDRSLPDL